MSSPGKPVVTAFWVVVLVGTMLMWVGNVLTGFWTWLVSLFMG